jgi:glycerol-3-phosphate dehydrogenase subunit B
MIPKTFLKGCAIKQGNKSLLIVDFKGFREFSARQIINVIQDSSDASALTIEIPDVSGDLNPIRLANLFEDDQFLKTLSNKITSFPKKIDLIGFPAVCGLKNSTQTIKKLEKLTSSDCFEIPGMPPSLPGLRLKNAFEKQLSQKNCTFLNNSKINSHEVKDNQFILNATTQNRDTQITAKGVILASGRFPGGGLHAQREKISETVFDLPVCQPEKRSQWYQLNFFNPNGHCINKAGIETDDNFQPVDKNNTPIFKNLYAAGSILAHNDWVRLKSGSGVSCVSAFTAVNNFYNSEFNGGKNV